MDFLESFFLEIPFGVRKCYQSEVKIERDGGVKMTNTQGVVKLSECIASKRKKRETARHRREAMELALQLPTESEDAFLILGCLRRIMDDVLFVDES